MAAFPVGGATPLRSCRAQRATASTESEFVIAYGVTGVEGKSSLVECSSVSSVERLVDLGGVRKHPGKGMPLLRDVLAVTLCCVGLFLGEPVQSRCSRVFASVLMCCG